MIKGMFKTATSYNIKCEWNGQINAIMMLEWFRMINEYAKQ